MFWTIEGWGITCHASNNLLGGAFYLRLFPQKNFNRILACFIGGLWPLSFLYSATAYELLLGVFIAIIVFSFIMKHLLSFCFNKIRLS